MPSVTWVEETRHRQREKRHAQIGHCSAFSGVDPAIGAGIGSRERDSGYQAASHKTTCVLLPATHYMII